VRRVAFAFVAVGCLTVPATAGGLLQDLFSGAHAPPPVYYYRYAPPPPQMRFVYDPGLRVSRKASLARKAMPARALLVQRKSEQKKKANLSLPRKSAHVAKPSIGRPIVTPRPAPTALCCRNGENPATTIHSDETLRVGDAYMTPQGLRIYRGRAARNEGAAFIDYRKAGIGKAMQARFNELERSRPHGGFAAIGTNIRAAATARFAGESSVKGAPPMRTALDPQGRVIRVVGP
jgi:hypothetical protein